MPEKVFLRRVLLHYFNMKKTAAESHRIIFASYCYWWWEMDPLRQPQAQKIIYETWPTNQINGKAEYPWREGNALYLVGSEGCAVLWAAKTGWNHQWRTLPNTINPFEESNSRKAPGICDQTRGNNFPSYPRPCPFWLPFVPIDAERPHWNTVHIRTVYQKLALFILGRQAGAFLLGWTTQIARKMGKSHSFRWATLWIILLYMFF